MRPITYLVRQLLKFFELLHDSRLWIHWKFDEINYLKTFYLILYLSIPRSNALIYPVCLIISQNDDLAIYEVTDSIVVMSLSYTTNIDYEHNQLLK